MNQNNHSPSKELFLKDVFLSLKQKFPDDDSSDVISKWIKGLENSITPGLLKQTNPELIAHAISIEMKNPQSLGRITIFAASDLSELEQMTEKHPQMLDSLKGFFFDKTNHIK